MTDFELIVLGFFGGIFTSIIMIGVGVAYDTRICKRKLSDNSCVCSDVSDRGRDRSGNNRRLKRMEAEEDGEEAEKYATVLQTMKHCVGWCRTEKEALDYAIKFIEKYGDYE